MQKEKIFIHKFCAIAYFRIPEFRDQVLKILEDSNQD